MDEDGESGGMKYVEKGKVVVVVVPYLLIAGLIYPGPGARARATCHIHITPPISVAPRMETPHQV